MTIYVDQITMVLIMKIVNLIVKGNVSDVKKYKNSMCFKRYYRSKTSRYIMQYRYTVTCCECLDGMKKYNDKRKSELKP